ncbi:MAG TPA: helix-turn-helix domain-containing protein [Ktedonobacteraceae bacterium]|nr:helix-turn-helix domain-containing protein [Ktedonobacteraceae bacterium]
MSKEDSWFTLNLSALIKDAREKKQETQDALAEYIGVDPKTIRNWENGKTALTDWRKIQKLAEHLSIPLEAFNVVEQRDFTSQEAREAIFQAKKLFDEGKFSSAYDIGDSLLSNLTRQVKGGEKGILQEYANALYFAGHAASIAKNDPQKALSSYKRLEKAAEELQDDNWLCLALTYQGEMYRRQRKYKRAIDVLKSAPQGPEIDVFLRGNCAQLLARAYGKTGQRKKAVEMLKLAEDLALREAERASDIYVCYTLCGVYEEYARHLMHDSPARSLQYIKLAKKQALPAPRWQIPLLLTEGEILLRAVGRTEVRNPKLALRERDYETGKLLIVEAMRLAKEGGHKRQEQRATRLPQLFQREQMTWNHIALDLAESLRPPSSYDPGDDY